MLWILKFLPQNYISSLTGSLMHLPLPGPLRQWSIKAFASFYHINLIEAEKPIEQYQSIGDFFVRKLKLSLRPLSHAKILHPADAMISAAGRVRMGQILQVKGKPYSVEQILDSPERAKDLEGGFFATYYLCPTDYHRVHSPVSGKILSAEHIPGRLWPVFKKSVESIRDLFAVNERMIVTIETELGKVSVVFVGALNVGKIELAFDRDFSSQVSGVHKKRLQTYHKLKEIKAGDELGLFRMGSTVVVFYPPSYSTNEHQLQALVGQTSKVRAPLF